MKILSNIFDIEYIFVKYYENLEDGELKTVIRLAVVLTFVFAQAAHLNAQEPTPVGLAIAAPIMLGRDHNAGCEIAKDSMFKAQLDFHKATTFTSNRPWEAFDFKMQPEEYMQAVLQNVLADNDAIDWDIGNNPNGWVHAPWMTQDREPFRGMTRERNSRPFELHPMQAASHTNYAFGVYNSIAAKAFESLWENPTFPSTDTFLMANGSVAVKLLFTTATDSEVPYLKNTKEVDFCANDDKATGHLAQLDIAVRDTRADQWTGWVFGTFLYWGEASDGFDWNNVRPFTLQWGNDPTTWPPAITDPMELQLSDLPPIDQSWFNEELQKTIGAWRKQNGLKPWTGLFGRANGPIDNPNSSCLSCHNVAADFGRGSDQNPFMNSPNSWIDAALETGNPSENLLSYFQNRKPKEPKLDNTLALDYSLQAMIGVLNFRAWAECRGTPAPHPGPIYNGSRPRMLDTASCLEVLEDTGDITFTPAINLTTSPNNNEAFRQTRSGTILNTMKLQGAEKVSKKINRNFR